MICQKKKRKAQEFISLDTEIVSVEIAETGSACEIEY
jgi:hypothetical protein